MARPCSYSPEKVSVIKAISKMRPRPGISAVSALLGMPVPTVRYYMMGLDKREVTEPWSDEVLRGLKAVYDGDKHIAAYHLVAAAKIFLNQSP